MEGDAKNFHLDCPQIFGRFMELINNHVAGVEDWWWSQIFSISPLLGEMIQFD